MTSASQKTEQKRMKVCQIDPSSGRFRRKGQLNQLALRRKQREAFRNKKRQKKNKKMKMKMKKRTHLSLN